MRLSPIQKKALIYALENVEDKAFLFGSRTNDAAKGGDIDICILSDKNAYNLSQQIRLKFWQICEEKIDIVVMDKNNLLPEQRTFLTLIEQSFIPLN